MKISLTYVSCPQNDGGLQDELRCSFKKGLVEAKVYSLSFDCNNKYVVFGNLCVHSHQSNECPKKSEMLNLSLSGECHVT
jgi:hypothetical protein